MTNALFIFRHCSKKILRCVRRDLFKEDARCYCSVKDSDGAKAKGQNFRDVILRKWISPSEEEARSMESLFPNAKETMGLVCTGSERAQVLDRQSVAGFLEHLAGMQTPALNNSTNFNLIQSIHQREDDNVYWLSTLQVHWPLSFSVTSESTNYELYVDASGMGMGGYLLANDTEQIHWISDSWSNEQHGYNLVDADS
ncbi:hypothetical protein MAR_010694, partial [Mya arenaria]